MTFILKEINQFLNSDTVVNHALYTDMLNLKDNSITFRAGRHHDYIVEVPVVVLLKFQFSVAADHMI